MQPTVTVVGAGPAGLMAASVAAEAGARVMLADEQDELGGTLLGAGYEIGGATSSEWLQGTIAALAEHENVTLLPRSTAFGYYDHNFLAIAERCADHLPESQALGVRQRLWRVRARQVILAQGAFERPLVFCNNDRPGVIGSIGTLLADHQINIAWMHFGREAMGGMAISVVAVDQAVSEEQLEEIRGLPNILSARQVHL